MTQFTVDNLLAPAQAIQVEIEPAQALDIVKRIGKLPAIAGDKIHHLLAKQGESHFRIAWVGGMEAFRVSKHNAAGAREKLNKQDAQVISDALNHYVLPVPDTALEAQLVAELPAKPGFGITPRPTHTSR